MSSLLGPADPSFRALSGRLKLTVRRHNFKTDSLSVYRAGAEGGARVDHGDRDEREQESELLVPQHAATREQLKALHNLIFQEL